jgi:glycosyltransferase involved in cell wall biosynthesis
MTRPLRVALCADYPQEHWPSMDRVADRLFEALRERHGRGVDVTLVCPRFQRRATRAWPSHAGAANIDRGINRLIDYPRHVARLAASYDLFHVIDHSYSQLVHRLPPGRTIVTCHDLDTFRSVLTPEDDPRSPLFNMMIRHILSGLRRAAFVTCDTESVRAELVARGIMPLERTTVAPVGVGQEFSVSGEPEADAAAARLIGAPQGSLEILHVGSTIARKRIDVVLHCCARLRRHLPIHLVRVGGSFTPAQEAIARELGLSSHMSVLPTIPDRVLAAVYRRAAIVILPSEREGFGLPVVEAMACGTVVLASDLPVLREVGGTAVTYCPGFDATEWARAAASLLRERSQRPQYCALRRENAIAHAQGFTWAAFADRIAAVYQNVAPRAGREAALDSATCPV